MHKTYRSVMMAVLISSVVIMSVICWHSIEEIHYLKSFFPKNFTVEEAFYASMVELIKIVIISVPFLLIIWIGLFFIRETHKSS